MPPPSKQTVLRAYFVIGLNLFPGVMVTSQDAEKDGVIMELHPAGVMIVGPKGTALVPYPQVKCINLA